MSFIYLIFWSNFTFLLIIYHPAHSLDQSVLSHITAMTAAAQVSQSEVSEGDKEYLKMSPQCPCNTHRLTQCPCIRYMGQMRTVHTHSKRVSRTKKKQWKRRNKCPHTLQVDQTRRRPDGGQIVVSDWHSVPVTHMVPVETIIKKSCVLDMRCWNVPDTDYDGLFILDYQDLTFKMSNKFTF